MTGHNIPDVDITIGTNMYGRIPDLPNTVSHVMAEFVDNALQSYYDRKTELMGLDTDYRLRIDIRFEWDEKTKSMMSVEVTDNAGGIDAYNFQKAFKLATTPDNNQGLNEFGMGLKTAALWLGRRWNVKTTALGESVSRSITFNLDDVVAHGLTKLDVETEYAEQCAHFTVVTISNPTNNAPSRKVLDALILELGSIYRKSILRNEADIFVDGVKLSYEYPEILCAPSVKAPDGPPVCWRKDIDFKFKKYHATGFIGILKTIDSKKNGLVLLRRGRVVYGAGTNKYNPKSICGSVGTFRYKRIFGELELEGFDVSFNKNDIQGKEDLDALMEALRGEIHTKEFDLYNQAEDYRLDEHKKTVDNILKAHNKGKKKREKVEIVTTPNKSLPSTLFASEPRNSPYVTAVDQPTVLGDYEDTYSIDGKDYKLKVDMVEGDKNKDLVWLDTSMQNEKVIICKINIAHVFFQYFSKSEHSVIAILKTMALAKFTAKEFGNDTSAELFDNFNTYIKQTKI